MDAIPLSSLIIILVFATGLSYIAWFQYDRLNEAMLPYAPEEAQGCLHAFYSNPILKWTIRLAYALMLLTTAALLVAKLTYQP